MAKPMQIEHLSWFTRLSGISGSFEPRLALITACYALLCGCVYVPVVEKSHKEAISSAKTVYIDVQPRWSYEKGKESSNIGLFEGTAHQIFALTGMTGAASRESADVVFSVITESRINTQSACRSVPGGQRCQVDLRTGKIVVYSEISTRGEFRLEAKPATPLRATFASGEYRTLNEAFQNSGFLRHLVDIMADVYGIPFLESATQDSGKMVQEEASWRLWGRHHLAGVWVPRESPWT